MGEPVVSESGFPVTHDRDVLQMLHDILGSQSACPFDAFPATARVVWEPGSFRGMRDLPACNHILQLY